MFITAVFQATTAKNQDFIYDLVSFTVNLTKRAALADSLFVATTYTDLKTQL